MGDAEDFWPSLDNVEDPDSPVVLLRRQAELLSDKSGHRLRGRVETSTIRAGDQMRELLGIDRGETLFNQAFMIEVPSLDDYTYTLFHVVHSMEPYPVACDDDERWQVLLNMRAFKEWLRQTISSERTKRVLQTLTQQAG